MPMSNQNLGRFSIIGLQCSSMLYTTTAGVFSAPQLRKTSKITVNKPQENGTPKDTFVKPQLKPVPPKETTKLQSKEVKVPVKLNSVKDSPAKTDIRKTTARLQEQESIEKVCNLTDQCSIIE